MKEHDIPIWAFCLHWTGSPDDTPLDVACRAIDEDHREKGWGGNGYHAILDYQRCIWQITRGLSYRGANVYRRNNGLIGLAVKGTPHRIRQYQAGEEIVGSVVRLMETTIWNGLWARGLHLDTKWAFYSHNQLRKTDCGDMIEWEYIIDALNKVYNRKQDPERTKWRSGE